MYVQFVSDDNVPMYVQYVSNDSVPMYVCCICTWQPVGGSIVPADDMDITLDFADGYCFSFSL